MPVAAIGDDHLRRDQQLIERFSRNDFSRNDASTSGRATST